MENNKSTWTLLSGVPINTAYRTPVVANLIRNLSETRIYRIQFGMTWGFFKMAVFFTALCALFFSCEKDDTLDPEKGQPVTGDTLKVNTFIHDYTKELYLWTSTIDWKTQDPKYERNSFEFFDKLIYKKVDRWSMLTDDAQSFYNALDGISTSFGYELIWGRFNENSKERFAVVLYVYPRSPAEKAGLKRGDFLLTINGFEPITDTNYMSFYNAPSIVCGRAVLKENDDLVMDATPISMDAVTMYEDPVVKDTVIVKGSHKIGYLFYTSYTQESANRLLEVFFNFKSQGVNDVVLDLRYNGGGYAYISCLLSSILAPKKAVTGKSVFLTQTWNDQCMEEFKKEGEDTNEYFIHNIPVNMDLSRLYVLTMKYSASASEATIIGLKPYMNVIQIGEATHGKYYGGALIGPMVYDRVKKEWIADKQLENWLMYLMIYRYADKNGDVSFSGGLVPHFAAKEDYFPLYPLGSERDPLLGKAIEMITGEPIVHTRAKPIQMPFKIDDAKLRSPLNGKMIHTGEMPF